MSTTEAEVRNVANLAMAMPVPPQWGPVRAVANFGLGKMMNKIFGGDNSKKHLLEDIDRIIKKRLDEAVSQINENNIRNTVHEAVDKIKVVSHWYNEQLQLMDAVDYLSSANFEKRFERDMDRHLSAGTNFLKAIQTLTDPDYGKYDPQVLKIGMGIDLLMRGSRFAITGDPADAKQVALRARHYRKKLLGIPTYSPQVSDPKNWVNLEEKLNSMSSQQRDAMIIQWGGESNPITSMGVRLGMIENQWNEQFEMVRDSGTQESTSLGDHLNAEGKLVPGQRLTSANGLFELHYQSNGNLVLYTSDRTPIWETETYGKSAGEAVLQGDGNFCLNDSNRENYWSTGKHGFSNARLVLQDDGNLVVYKSNNSVAWASKE